MRKRSLIAVALGVSLVIAFGGLYASNMGFKLNKLLQPPAAGVSQTGTNALGLPFNPQTSLLTAADLFADINDTGGTPGCNANIVGACATISIAKFLKETDGLLTYNGKNPNPAAGLDNFDLDGTEGLRVQVDRTVNYIVVGSHDPGKTVALEATSAVSNTGTQSFSFPYHGTATTAADLFAEINGSGGTAGCNANIVGDCATISIARFLTETDGLVTYNGKNPNPAAGLADFPLAPGESYRVQVDRNVSYTPSHY